MGQVRSVLYYPFFLGEESWQVTWDLRWAWNKSEGEPGEYTRQLFGRGRLALKNDLPAIAGETLKQ